MRDAKENDHPAQDGFPEESFLVACAAEKTARHASNDPAWNQAGHVGSPFKAGGAIRDFNVANRGGGQICRDVQQERFVLFMALIRFGYPCLTRLEGSA
jgi:hypothetical protein